MGATYAWSNYTSNFAHIDILSNPATLPKTVISHSFVKKYCQKTSLAL